MGVVNRLGERGAATARAQLELLGEVGVVEYLRTRPGAARDSLEFLLHDLDSMLMDPAELHRKWAERSGDYSPDFYAELGPDEGSEAIRSVLDAHVSPDAAILELGCSAGRHLAYLHDHGHRNLYGIEINEDALAVAEEAYPALVADGTFYLDAIEHVVPTFEDDQFDVVFSVETLELVHPDNAWVFEELARITSHLLITVENEDKGDRLLAAQDIDGFPLFYRPWKEIFTNVGLEEVSSMEDEIDTIRVFRNS